jgi:hypothetical protein
VSVAIQGWLLCLVTALAMSQASCTTTLYQGRRELLGTDAPTLESPGTVIDEIDGQKLEGIRQDLSRYVLRPGLHVIAFRRLESRLLSGGRDPRPGDLVRVCVVTRTGHHYQTVAERKPNSREWVPSVLESNEHQASGPGDDGTPHRVSVDCAKERLPATASPAAPPTTPAVTTPSAPPVTPSEVPDVSQLWSREKIARYDPLPFVDLTLNVGLAGGGGFAYRGDNTVYLGSCHEFCAGDGVSVNIGAMVTPVWIGERVGFGGGIELGYKLALPPVGSERLRRYPARATGHATLHLWGRWFAILSAGPTKDFAVRFSSDYSSEDLASNVGLLGRLTVYRRIGDSSAFMLSLVKIWQSYRASDESLDAGSFGFAAGGSFAL